MAIAAVGEKFQVVIPKEIRQMLGLKPRDQLLLWVDRDRLEAMPLKKHADPLKVLESLSKKRHRFSIEALEEELERGAARQ